MEEVERKRPGHHRAPLQGDREVTASACAALKLMPVTHCGLSGACITRHCGAPDMQLASRSLVTSH